ncbi:N-acetylmuramoyl-L-alanine amidase [Cellulosimicrobium cellulans]|uniref:peptidoglycan recognition protein family protein n=1 Tax=Cellulosimicrobium cellulans TaxID=1710 RepID=UPI001BA5C7FD|nr:N-acetylmuramoyl-L-alanine amidase [Cellulosimicrobium cellulans]QUC01108.1 N-acetylmuramoyl-L-alanine amidase [Cellulosimicrobium cellulans]
MRTRSQLVASRSKTNKGTNARRYITVHETANTKRGADAAAHANLQSSGNVRQASWHWSVDDTEAVQSFPHTVRCWHGGTDTANNESLAVEICVNADGDFQAAVRNAAALVRRLMAQEGIPLSRVVQHEHWTGKGCPAFLRSGSRGITWMAFLALVRDGEAAPAPAPATPKPAAPAPSSSPVLHRGSKGAAVRALQAGLNRVFPAYSKLALDGSFGPATERVVREFQRRAGLVVDGYVGPKTRASLAAHGVRF